MTLYHANGQPMQLNLRPYQAECVEKVFEQMDQVRSTLVVMPTGTGKTVQFAHVTKRFLEQNPGKRVMVMAHRQELIDQAADKIGVVTGFAPAIEMGELRADEADGWIDRSRVIITTVQTQNAGKRCTQCFCHPCDGKGGTEQWQEDDDGESKKEFVACEACAGNGYRAGCDTCIEGRLCRMLNFPAEQFGLLIIDEAHHTTARTYQRVVKHFGGAKVLGVTATPDRADEEALGKIYDSVAYDYEIPDAIRDGWLVPIDQQLVRVDDLDFTNVRTTAGDLNQGDLEKAMMPAGDIDRSRSDLTDEELAAIEREERLLHSIVDPTIQLAGDRPALIFATSVVHAERIAEIINRHRDGSAVSVHGGTPSEERRQILYRFKHGQFQFLVNCMLFTEGFDETRISVVAIARPTKSRALYAQMVGRGTRPLPGLVDGPYMDADGRCEAIACSEKSALLVLDFVGNSGRHKLVTTADILGGNYDDATIERAKAAVAKASANGKSADALEELVKAQKEIEAEERKRRAQVIARASFRTQKVNPFDVLDIMPTREPGWHKGRKPTDRQLEVIAKAGIEVGSDTTFWEASQILDALSKRRDRKQCTYKQAKILGRFGYDPNMGFDDARRTIDAIVANNWKRPPEAVEV